MRPTGKEPHALTGWAMVLAPKIISATAHDAIVAYLNISTNVLNGRNIYTY